jgi:anaerobic glycerol-3-phosphate dehydrogenase
VSVLVARDDRQLLVLERAWVMAAGIGQNTIRVFEATLDPKPDALEPVPGAPPSVLSKRLVLDLKHVVSRFDAGNDCPTISRG